jgi:hypothetical protein
MPRRLVLISGLILVIVVSLLVATAML